MLLLGEVAFKLAGVATLDDDEEDEEDEDDPESDVPVLSPYGFWPIVGMAGVAIAPAASTWLPWTLADACPRSSPFSG
jgi:hypothetical protein